MKKIAVIIVIYKFPQEKIKKLKESIIKAGIKDRDVFIRDNTHDNVGYGAGINKILKQQINNYDYFLILNPDIELKKDTIAELVKTLDKDSGIGIVGAKILDEKGKIWGIGGELDKKRYSGGLIDFQKENKKYKDKVISVDFVSGTVMLIRKEIFENIGFFPEDYFIYYEDVEFSKKANGVGFRLATNLQAEITHFASTTMGKNSPAQQYYMARNHMFFVERFAPFSVKLHEFLRLPKTLYEAKDKKYVLLGLRDYFLRKGGKRDYWS